ncbi:MAG: energy transducer TonB, partial [Rikenellaceae bacterium]
TMMNKNELYKDKIVRLGDLFKAPKKCINNAFGSDELKVKVDKKDKDILFKMLPFVNMKKSVDEWLYRNRRGVVWVSVSYMLILILIMFVRYDVSQYDSRDSIYIDVPLEALPDVKEPEPIEEQQMSEEELRRMANEPVRNVSVDENSSLDTRLRDAKSINSDKLYDEARKVQQDLEATNKRYQKGLEAIQSKNANIRGGDNSEKNIGESSKNSDGSSSVEKGNVTVSFNLKGRGAVYLEVPAYRCEGGGRVVVNIVVAMNGDVVSATVRSATGVTDPCVQEMALQAAKMSSFTVSHSGGDRQVGTMTFLFVQQ